MTRMITYSLSRIWYLSVNSEVQLSEPGVRLLVLERAEKRLEAQLPEKQLAVEKASAALKAAVLDLHETRDLQLSVRRELRILRLAFTEGDVNGDAV